MKLNKSQILFILLILTTVCIVAYFYFNTKTLEKENSKPVANELQWAELKVDSSLIFPSLAHAEQMLHYRGFALAYDEESEQAIWVCYELTENEAKGQEKRSDNFRSDHAVLSESASLNDYRKSGYDRGHLAPAGDMKWSKQSMSQSFLMSNMSPQVAGFNRGIWKKLEAEIRKWVVRDKNLWVITGPIFYEVIDQIGPNKVWVPSHYYKIVVDVTLPQIKSIAFIMPNEKLGNNMFDYVVSIDLIEQATGIDFLEKMPIDYQNYLESQNDFLPWR